MKQFIWERKYSILTTYNDVALLLSTFKFSQWYHSKNSVKHSEMKIKPKYLNGYNVSLT